VSGGFALGEFANATNQGAVTTTSKGSAAITSGSSANTKGSYVQLVASSSIDAAWMMVIVDGVDINGKTVGVDIAVGASGSEQPIVQNLIAGGSDTGSWPTYCFPVCIPAGTRISARAQSTSASDNNIFIGVEIFDTSFQQSKSGSGIINTYGFVSGSTVGTPIDPGTTANTKGAYAQLTASITNDLVGFFLGFDRHGDGTTTTDVEALLDVAVGAAGSESVILPNLYCLNENTSNINLQHPDCTPFLPIHIPSGTRIAARAQGSATTATARVLGLTFYGVRA
jgi:hypothetical protein